MESEFLSFSRGDIIRILEKTDLEDGWLFGFVHDKKGKFPASYVEDYQPVSNFFNQSGIRYFSTVRRPNYSVTLRFHSHQSVYLIPLAHAQRNEICQTLKGIDIAVSTSCYKLAKETAKETP